MNQLSITLLKEASDCFKEARKNVYDGARLLYRIQADNLWEGQYSSFTEYVEQECQLSKSYLSKLLQAWKYYVIDGGVKQSSLVGIDSDKLYFAMRLPTGSVEQRLVKAKEWNREDLRAELSTVDGHECEHPPESQVTLCGKCQKRVG